MNLNIFPTISELNANLINYVIEIANTAIRTKGRFNFVLTGGNSPKELYRELSTTYAAEIDWTKVFFFFGDERNVLPTHQDYNGLMAKENLFNNLGTPATHIFYVDTTLAPEAAALAYKAALEKHFDGEKIAFDLILLGMGDDAHTASIFPFTDLVACQTPTVAAVWVEKLNTYRISLSATLINAAEHVAFITFGQNKADALKHVIADTVPNYTTYPAQLIAPVSGNLTWFVDELAAEQLREK